MGFLAITEFYSPNIHLAVTIQIILAFSSYKIEQNVFISTTLFYVVYHDYLLSVLHIELPPRDVALRNERVVHGKLWSIFNHLAGVVAQLYLVPVHAGTENAEPRYTEAVLRNCLLPYKGNYCACAYVGVH